MANWNTLPATTKQMEAIHSYEITWNVSIHCNNKQDAHDIISIFVKNRRLIFKNGFIEGTNVAYDKIDRSLDIIELSIKQFNNYERELQYDDDLRELDDRVFGCDPYRILH